MMAQTMAPPAAAPIAMPTMTPVDRPLDELEDEPREPDGGDESGESGETEETEETEGTEELVALGLDLVCVTLLAVYWPLRTLEQSAAADEKTSISQHKQVSTGRQDGTMPTRTYLVLQTPRTQPRHTQTSPPQWHWRCPSRTRTRSRRAGSPSTW